MFNQIYLFPTILLNKQGPSYEIMKCQVKITSLKLKQIKFKNICKYPSYQTTIAYWKVQNFKIYLSVIKLN